VKKNRKFQRSITSPLAAFPANTRVSDCICILLDASTPYVLRPINDHFRVVGQCYVDGIMFGECLKELKSALREFVLQFVG